MNATPSPGSRNLDTDLLQRLADLPVAQALEELGLHFLRGSEAIQQLAQAALEQAEAQPDQAARWLEIATALAREHPVDPGVLAQIDYAQARLHVLAGQLAEAEARLQEAQSRWQAVGDRHWLTRSYLGLTQILAMQGRYAEAEAAVRQAIAELMAGLDGNQDPVPLARLTTAHRNLATLLLYQERHAAALAEYELAQTWLERFRRAAGAAGQPFAANEAAHIALNQATALTFLDRPTEAEAALQAAIHHFDQARDALNRGRARTNLGRLYLRTGRYGDALATFNLAAQDLIGDLPIHAVPEVEALRRADELLLEHATAYLALNLLPEAADALERCLALFQQAGQPYELGQTFYTLALVQLREGRLAEAQASLARALAQFAALDNPFWLNRTQLAQATVAFVQGDLAQAAAHLASLSIPQGLAPRDPSTPLAWDVAGLAEAHLLQARLLLAQGKLEAAGQVAARIPALLGGRAAGTPTIRPPMPHLHLRVEHLLGQVARAAGDLEQARRHLTAAVTLLEMERAALPLEEIRTAFLDDKSAIYQELVLTLLDAPDLSEEGLAAAFAVVERARSRALLERLLASVQGATSPSPHQSRREAVRQRLHWLYSRLLGEGSNAQLDAAFNAELQAQEALLQQLEWRDSPMLSQAEPTDLASLQACLEPGQQALAYFMAGEEVLAFVIGQDQVRLFRRLTTVEQLNQALAEFRFQLGRVELGPAYLARHRDRLMRQLTGALAHLHDLLIAPLASALSARRLLVIPYGSLHLLPFHALWDGRRYLLERYELSTAPSASVAVHVRHRRTGGRYRSLAGLAIQDDTIPAAQEEVRRIAALFPAVHLYLEQEATRAGLWAAARAADVLHLATHGLFRPDNSFFSALKLADGWVDVREIYRLPLAARLVVLSACESGAGQVRGGDEVIGLARGFLAAGARHLVVSLWNVHDASAAGLMENFYRALMASPCPSPAAALRTAQRAAVAEGQHPYYWAPYLVMG